MRFTYIVQLILVVNVTVSAMNVLPAEGLLFFFLILSMVMSAWQLLIGMWIVCAAVLLMV